MFELGMRKITNIFYLIFFIFPVYANADVYRYSDEQGGIYLTDSPSDSQYELMLAEPVIQMPNVINLTKNYSYEIKSSLAESSTRANSYASVVNLAAQMTGVDKRLLHAVISTESNYNPNAVSSKGAGGLMQLMPQTAKRYGVENVFDPVQNIHAGARYLADLLSLFNNDFVLAVAAYNAGENSVIRYGKKIPPYRETMDYVNKVTRLYNGYQKHDLM